MKYWIIQVFNCQNVFMTGSQMLHLKEASPRFPVPQLDAIENDYLPKRCHICHHKLLYAFSPLHPIFYAELPQKMMEESFLFVWVFLVLWVFFFFLIKTW